MRAFVAIDIDPEVRRKLSALARDLKPLLRNARFVPEENLHLTLRFLGDVQEERRAPLVAGLEAAAHQLSPFSFDLDGAGVFPDRGRPRILWVGAIDPPPALGELQRTVETAMRGLGFEPERRPFRAHLTLARLRGPERRLSEVLETCRERRGGLTQVEEIVLYRSELSSTGAKYHAVRRFRLSR